MLGKICKASSASGAYYTPQIHPEIQEESCEIDENEFMLNALDSSDSSDEMCK